MRISQTEQYLLYKKTYIDRLDGVNTDEFTSIYNNNELINLVEHHKRNRDIFILLFSLAYLLNIVDASANAHLFNYDISEEIGFQLKPSYYTNNNSPGIVLSIKFQICIMNIAIFGNGKMGQEISSLAKSRGHVISCVSSSKNPAKKLNLRNIDIAIEFSTPETAFDNICYALQNIGSCPGIV